jgi:hypothetical protein
MIKQPIKGTDKNVLVVAYDYPPLSQNVGRVRPSKFVKYLPEFGWNPLVMTLAPTNWSATSRSVDRGTFHVKEWPHPLKAYYSFQEQRAKRQGRAEQFAMKMSTPHAIAVGSSKRGIVRLKRLLLDFLSFPDLEVSWFVPAVLRASHIIRQKNIQCLITTAPPYSVQLIGLALKRLTGCGGSRIIGTPGH